MSDEISTDAKRDILLNVLIAQARNTLYAVKIQKRAAEIAGDAEDAKAWETRFKQMAARIAVYEEELEGLGHEETVAG